MNRSRGFTLIELISAVAIFGVLAAMLFQMIKGSLDVWRTGEQGRQTQEKGVVLMDEIASDLRMLRADPAPGVSLLGAGSSRSRRAAAGTAPEVRLGCEYAAFDLDMDGRDESILQRLRLVRSCPEELFDARLRRAGTVPGGEAFSSDVGEAQEAVRAPGGLAEVGYAVLRLPAKESDPALLSLYRLFRTPIGGDDSLFHTNLFDRPKGLESQAVPLADNVLHLGFEFWSRDTRSWDDEPDTDVGPLTVWDSTRGALLEEGTYNDFLLSKGEESLSRGDDDVFPRRIRVTLVLAMDLDSVTTIRLVAGVGPAGRSLRVDNLKEFEGSRQGDQYLKVGGEWMKWTRGVADELKVVRGQRNSAALAHEIGARVHLGRTFRRVVEIPVFREDWNDS